MKVKICGMKLNTGEVAALKPDYLGFIFWEQSPRYFTGPIPPLQESVAKVGVFVDATIEEVLRKTSEYGLNMVQLHGGETPEFCAHLRTAMQTAAYISGGGKPIPEIIKVFSVKDETDLGMISEFEEVCDYFLFDTKGKLPGGNGYAFDWELLSGYPSQKPFFLSGGIGPGAVTRLWDFFDEPVSKFCHAIDLNSKFEIAPGHKDINALRTFIHGLSVTDPPKKDTQ
jgi:phosphoribosylanthranilate isomerase